MKLKFRLGVLFEYLREWILRDTFLCLWTVYLSFFPNEIRKVLTKHEKLVLKSAYEVFTYFLAYQYFRYIEWPSYLAKLSAVKLIFDKRCSFWKSLLERSELLASIEEH